MINKHYRGIFLGIAILTFIMTACSSENSGEIANNPQIGQHDAGSNIGISTEIPSSYMKEMENVIFDCEIDTSLDLQKENLYTATAKIREIDHEKAFAELFSEVTEFEREEFEGINEFGKKVVLVAYHQNHEISFSYGPLSSQISFLKNDLLQYIMPVFCLDEKSTDYNADSFSSDLQLSFSSKDKVIENVNAFLERINGGMDYICKSYSLDSLTLQEQASKINVTDIYGNESRFGRDKTWTEQDECYYVLMRQKFERIPVYHKYANYFTDESEMNTPIQVIVSNNGIEMFKIERVFEFENLEKIYEIVSFDQVADTANKIYGRTLGDNSYVIKSARLFYFVNVSQGEGEYEVRPCWILKGEQNVSGNISGIQLIIDAQSGEEIIP